MSIVYKLTTNKRFVDNCVVPLFFFITLFTFLVYSAFLYWHLYFIIIKKKKNIKLHLIKYCLYINCIAECISYFLLDFTFLRGNNDYIICYYIFLNVNFLFC